VLDLTPAEARVLGCLLEKQRLTPDAYPLSLNALRLACNQATNRDPVVDYDEATVRDALARLSRRRWVRYASGAGSRAPKYRHLLDEALGLGEPDLSLLCVLMLRGPQTPGELRARSERLRPGAGVGELDGALERLVSRGLAERQERRPGQKEARYAQRLGGPEAPPAVAAEAAGAPRAAPPTRPAGAPSPGAPPAGAPPEPLEPPAAEPDRLERLEAELAALRGEVGELRAALGSLRAELGA
jgi:uncharacterized protein YceH (UPF0502 family)